MRRHVSSRTGAEGVAVRPMAMRVHSNDSRDSSGGNSDGGERGKGDRDYPRKSKKG